MMHFGPPALAASEACLAEGPTLAATGSRAPSPAGLASTHCFSRCGRGPPSSNAGSRSGSREPSSERRASSPSCREALLRTRGVLAAARGRVVELEASLVQQQRQRTGQDALVHELQEQVRSLLEAQSKPTTAAALPELSPIPKTRQQEDLYTSCNYSAMASPLQACEAVLAQLEGAFASEVGISVPAAETQCTVIPGQPLQRCPKRRRHSPGAARLVAAAAARCETSTVLVMWTAWWSVWRGRHLKLRAVQEASHAPTLDDGHDAERRATDGALPCIAATANTSRDSRTGSASEQMARRCLWAWSRRASEEIRCRQHAILLDLQGTVDAHAHRAGVGRRLATSLVEQRSIATLQQALAQWRETVDCIAYYRRVSAAHASQCDRLRSAADNLGIASASRLSTRLVELAWLAWRCFSRSQMRSQVGRESECCWRIHDLVKTYLVAWWTCTVIARRGRFHRRQLLEVLAPQCALQRMCLAAWQRSARNSRVKIWSDQHKRAAEIRCEAMGALAAAMTGRREVAAAPLLPAWVKWKHLAANRHFRAHCAAQLGDRQALRRLVRHAVQAWSALARGVRSSWLAREERRVNQSRAWVLAELMAQDAVRHVAFTARRAWTGWRSLVRQEVHPHPAALASLTNLLLRSQTASLAMMAWRAWRQKTADHAIGEPSCDAACGFESSFLTPKRQSPSRIKLCRPSINGRPPSTATASTHGTTTHRELFGSVCAPAQDVFRSAPQRATPTQSALSAAQRRSCTEAQAPEPLGPRLPAAAVQQRSALKTDFEPATMRHVRSDPSLNMKLAAQSPVSFGFPRDPSQAACSPPASSNCASLAFDGHLTAALKALSASSAPPSTAGEVGLAASERSTCCPSTPRSTSGAPDVCPWTGFSSDPQPFGPPCNTHSTPQRASECKNAPSCQTPLGPKISPSPQGALGKALRRSASSGAPRGLTAIDLVRSTSRLSSSLSRQGLH